MDQRAAQADALLHPAGQLMRMGVLEALEADQPDKIAGRCPIVGDAQIADFDLQQHVLQHGAPRHQQRALEHDADRSASGR